MADAKLSNDGELQSSIYSYARRSFDARPYIVLVHGGQCTAKLIASDDFA